MQDLQREILNQVVAGTISAEEGAARLEALDSAAPTTPAPAAAAASPSGVVKQVKVISRFGNTEIIGDPTVATAVADGPHRAHQDGDTMVFEQTPVSEDPSFEFVRPQGRVVINGFGFGRKLTVRVNPSLPLNASVQAGNLRIEGVHSRLAADVQAGNCKVHDFRAPINLSVAAGNVEAQGSLDSGTSSIRCEMGQVKVGLARESSVRISARTTMGKVAIEGDGIRKGSNEVTVGTGAGTLELECTMGNVKVSVG